MKGSLVVVGGRPEAEGGQVAVRHVPPEQLERLHVAEEDVLVLDLGADGIAACSELRRGGTTAGIVVVLPTDDVRLRVAALDAGADDSVPSPAAWGELLARTHAIRRRRAGAVRDLLRACDVELDVRRFEARRGDRPLELTMLETRLLEFFLRNPRQLLPRSLIVTRVWGDASEVGENALEVYVGYLRRKLEAGGEPRLIQTVRGSGYAFAAGWPLD